MCKSFSLKYVSPVRINVGNVVVIVSSIIGFPEYTLFVISSAAVGGRYILSDCF